MSLTLLLVTLNLTVLYGQTGNPPDSISCYTTVELKRIADRVVRAKECDTLLTICEQQMNYMLKALDAEERASRSKDSIIIQKDLAISNKEIIITGKEGHVTALEEALLKEQRKHKLTKIGWIGTGVVSFFLIILAAVN